MANATWVCFECRATIRRSKWTNANVLCPHCGKPARFLSYKTRVPAKRDAKAWQELRKSLQKERVAYLDKSRPVLVRNIHELERKIAALQRRPATEGRKGAIRKARQMLAKLKGPDSLPQILLPFPE